MRDNALVLTTSLGRALLDSLDTDDLAILAERLRPLLLPAKPEPGPFLTATEAAEKAACHVETIRRAVRLGALPASSVGRSIRITTTDLDAWLVLPLRTRSVPRPSRPQTKKKKIMDFGDIGRPMMGRPR